LQRLDRAEQQNVEMQTTLQQTVTTQKAQILQIQSDHAKTIQQVRSLVKQHEHMRTDAKNTKESMATLEAGVNEMRHDQNKLKDNERADKEGTRAEFAAFKNDMVALTSEVAQLRETFTAMEQRFRNEREKLRNNERRQNVTFQGEFERGFQEFRASLETLHTELESLKIGDREERTKMEDQLREATAHLKTACKESMEELRQEIEHIIEVENRGNTTFDQSMEENLADSTVKIHQLRKEFEQFKNNQLEEHIGQQTNSPLGQIVEKLGQMVEQQTGFFGTILPQLLEQQTARPLLMQTFEQREMEDDSNQSESVIPTTISVSTKAPSNSARDPSHLTQSNTASVKANTSDKGDSSNPKQQKPSSVSGVLGLQVKTVTLETSHQTTIIPKFYYSRDETETHGVLIDLLIDLLLSKGLDVNTIIYVNSGQRLNFLQEFLHREGFDVFTKNQPHSGRIILVTVQDMVCITSIVTKEKDHKDHYFWLTFLEGVTTVLNYDDPPDLANYKWMITGGMDLNFAKKEISYASFIGFSNHQLCFELQKFLSDSQELEKLSMTPRPDIPTFLEYIAGFYTSQRSPQASTFNTPPKIKQNGGGTSQHTRPTSGSREFRSNLNARTAGDSPKTISDPSAREYIGMRPDDWKCSDCSGWVWEWKTECDSFTCQRRRQKKGISDSEMVSSPSRPKERELSVPCSPAVTKRTVCFAVDDEEDSRVTWSHRYFSSG
jgi:hypothetical protein